MVRRIAGQVRPAGAASEGRAAAPAFTLPGTYAVLRTGRKDFCYLVSRPLIFAGSFLNGEYIPSRNVLDLEKQSAIFLILKRRTDWIFKQINQETELSAQLRHGEQGKRWLFPLCFSLQEKAQLL